MRSRSRPRSIAASTPGDVVVALDGATIDDATAAAYAAAVAVPAEPGSMPPSSVSRSE